MKKFIISLPDENYSDLLGIYEANNPLPEFIMVNGVQQPNPYNSNQMMDMLISTLIHRNFTRIMGRNNITVTKEES